MTCANNACRLFRSFSLWLLLEPQAAKAGSLLTTQKQAPGVKAQNTESGHPDALMAAHLLDFCSLSQKQSVLNVYSKITNRILDFRMAKQDLNRANVSCGAINHRGLGPSQ